MTCLFISMLSLSYPGIKDALLYMPIKTRSNFNANSLMEGLYL